MERRTSVAGGVTLVLASWVVPGLGFVVKRDYWRGLAVFVLLSGTFLLGVLLHGSVVIPEWRFRSPSFNIVNLLMFIGEIGNGGACLLSMAFTYWGKTALQLTKLGSHPWFDLASLYLLVSGCMNYFCVTNFYDRYYGHRVQEAAEGERA